VKGEARGKTLPYFFIVIIEHSCYNDFQVIKEAMMTGTQKALIPGIAFGILVLLLLSRLVNPTLVAEAATEAATSNTTEAKSSGACAFYDRYPDKVKPWCGLIESASAKYGMDPLLIGAVMLQESGGQPEIMSSSGAVGLMQIMPRDGISASFQCINGPCFASRPTIEELKDPAFNVDYGVRMLAGLTERHGDVREALKSYGPYDVGYRYADQVLAIFSSL
jgi:soluble lytic murein transglycosylase-like protein